jgi:hypothetical protein
MLRIVEWQAFIYQHRIVAYIFFEYKALYPSTKILLRMQIPNRVILRLSGIPSLNLNRPLKNFMHMVLGQ